MQKIAQAIPNKRFHVLDSFRGLAALVVVMFHMQIEGSITRLSFFRHSDLFVELFFVLSGFVIAHSYGFRVNFSLYSFFISRTFRLFPLHIIMLLVFIFIEVGKLVAYKYGLSFNNAPFTGKNALDEILPNLFLLQSWTHLTDYMSFNTPSWSISIEYYMYFIFALLLYFKSSVRYILWGLISILMFLLLYTHNETLTLQVIKGLSSFFLGALIYLVYKKTHQYFSMSKSIATVIEITILTLTVIMIAVNFEHKVIVANLFFALIIFIFAFEKGYISSLLRLNIFAYFGKISYSIYMTHYAVLSITLSIFLVLQKVFHIELAPMVGISRFLTLGSPLLNNLLVFVLLGIVIFVSGLSYKYIEVKGQLFGKFLIRKQVLKYV